jgi:hypothetical protein
MSGKLIVKVISALLLIGLTMAEVFPCRPLKTEDCGTTPLGKPAVELGMQLENTKDGRETEVGYVFNVGLSARMDAGFELPFRHTAPDGSNADKGFDGFTLRSKYLLSGEKDSMPALLTKVTLTMPTADRENEIGNDKSNIGAYLVATKLLGDYTVFSTVGYITPAAGKNRDNSEGFLGVGLQRPVGKSALLAEFTYEQNFSSGDDVFGTTFGMVYSLSEMIAWDIALNKNLNDTDSGYTLITGLTTNF